MNRDLILVLPTMLLSNWLCGLESRLPIEYYDKKVLTFICNLIGNAIKVDKNTLTWKHGKYERLCIQFDLSKHLIVMSTIKGRHYKVKYEGLHLCLSCRKYGHYVETAMTAIMKNKESQRT